MRALLLSVHCVDVVELEKFLYSRIVGIRHQWYHPQRRAAEAEAHLAVRGSFTLSFYILFYHNKLRLRY